MPSLWKNLAVISEHIENIKKHFGAMSLPKFRCDRWEQRLAAHYIWNIGREIVHIRAGKNRKLLERFSDVDWEKLAATEETCALFGDMAVDAFFRDEEKASKYLLDIMQNDIPNLEKAVAELDAK